MKGMVSLTVTPSFTSCFSWLRFISWWPLPTGTGMSLPVRWRVSGQLSGWKSLLAGLALCCMFGHWWHHLFLQIVILTEWDLRHESLTLIIIYLKSAVFPTFVKLCVCASHVTSPVFWHGLDLPLAILFIVVLPSASVCVLEWIKSCMSMLVVS